MMQFEIFCGIMNRMKIGIRLRKGWVEIFDYKLTPTYVFLISLEQFKAFENSPFSHIKI